MGIEMSKQVTVSAALSVLMMSAYVLFGTGAAVTSFERDALVSPVEISAPTLAAPSRLLPSFAR
jgi:hypothetical protein